MEEDVRLRELVSSLSRNESAIEDAESYVRQGGGNRAHSYLCSAVLRGAGAGGREKECSHLLHCLGPAQALLAVHSNLPRVSLSTACWLAGETETVLDEATLTSLMWEECHAPSPLLSPAQEQLLSALTRLPDCLANQLGRSLPASLLPQPFFSALGTGMLGCLRRLHSDLRGGQDRSLAFPAAVLSRAAVLGHAETVLSQLMPTLEIWSVDDPLWARVSRSLFCRVSNPALEPVLMALVQLATPSLATPHPLYQLLGNLALINHRARLVLTHKLWLTRLPSNQSAVYTLIGYLSGWEEGRGLLVKSLQSALGIWSDGACVRRMESRHHLWLCQLLVLGTSCLAGHLTPPTASALRRSVMRGLQVHLDCPGPGVRQRGMAAGQSLMNCLHSDPTGEGLQFELGDSSDVAEILRLARPVQEQQRDLTTCPPRASGELVREEVAEREKLGTQAERAEEGGGGFGAGRMVSASEAVSDSDDDLEPFDMSHDPDPAHHHTPRYLRDCLAVLASPRDRSSVDAALSVLPGLVSSQPPDLAEVSVELARVLLHLQDSWDLPALPSLRHSTLVALTIARPRLLAPYLTAEFYSSNHNTRQRLDLLEVISSAATELSTPSPGTTHTPSALSTPSPGTTHTPSALSPTHTPAKKPWQQVVDERVRAKTRIISKGARKPPLSSPSKFSALAPLFFFPLMAPYDRALPTLDLLGRDSLLLGNLVRTLGNVLWCACHSPAEPAMARALLEFVWTLRYHSSSHVRQAVLCALSTVLVATPTNYLLSTDMQEALAEAMLWVQDVSSSDGDDEARALAGHTLSVLAATTKQLPSEA